MPRTSLSRISAKVIFCGRSTIPDDPAPAAGVQIIYPLWLGMTGGYSAWAATHMPTIPDRNRNRAQESKTNPFSHCRLPLRYFRINQTYRGVDSIQTQLSREIKGGKKRKIHAWVLSSAQPMPHRPSGEQHRSNSKFN